MRTDYDVGTWQVEAPTRTTIPNRELKSSRLKVGQWEEKDDNKAQATLKHRKKIKDHELHPNSAQYILPRPLNAKKISNNL